MDSKNTNNRFDRDFTNGYDLDNFDVDDDSTVGVTQGEPKESNPLDYGDDFGEQTGENNTKPASGFDGNYIDSRDIGSNSSNYKSKKPKNSGKKTGNNKKIAIALTIAAVICLIAAVTFACVQCSDRKDSGNKVSSVFSRAVTTKSTDEIYTDEVQTDEVVPVTEEIETEPAQTDAPPQEKTEVIIETTTEQQAQTEPETDPLIQTEPTAEEVTEEATYEPTESVQEEI